MRISANSIWMNYESKGKGEKLILIHGAGDNLGMWYNQVPAFFKSYEVITYDIRGAGKTDSPSGEYSIPLFVEDLEGLITAMKRQTTVSLDDDDLEALKRLKQGSYFLGYSLGGRIAIELAINRPELVKALILVNSAMGLTPPSPEFAERRKAMLELLEKKDIKKVAEMMTISAFSPDFKSKNPKVFDQYMKVKLQSKADGWARIMRVLGAPSAPPDLSKVTCPTLIVIGEFDAGAEQGRQAQKLIAGSKLVTLPTGHAAPIEAPDKFNAAVLEFLAEVKGK